MKKRVLKDSTIRKFLSRNTHGFVKPDEIPHSFVEMWRMIKYYESKENDFGARNGWVGVEKYRSIINAMHKSLNDEIIIYKQNNNTSMNPESLFKFICSQMKKLENNEITIVQAQVQANLARQANNTLSLILKGADKFISKHK